MLKKLGRKCRASWHFSPLSGENGQAGQVACSVEVLLELQPFGWMIRPCAQRGRCSVKIEANE
jgi:hypothetical protein